MPTAISAPTVYTLADVMRLTGAKRPQIEYWVRKHIIRGEFEMGAGTGLPRQFVFRNLVEVAVALELNALGINTTITGRMIDQLRYGDVETDVRTPWFAEMVPGRPKHQRLLSRAELRRQYRLYQEQTAADWTPLEDRCCAELNDDGTLKLLKLLRAYADAGVSAVEIRKGLLAVAREHLQERRSWQQDHEALNRRWRAFKNPSTRPRTGDFWLVCEAPEHSGGRGRWLRIRLTDNREKARETSSLGDAVIIVGLKAILAALEKKTGDAWRATAERDVSRPTEFMPTAHDLVQQAFREYERTEEIRLRATAETRVKKEQVDVSQ